MKDKVFAIVPVRLTSSRLEKKHLYKIGSKRLLEWTIYHIRKSKHINGIVISTPSKDNVKILKQYINDKDVFFFSYDKDENDVVGRLTKTAVEFDAEICVLVSGDVPIPYINSVDRLILALKKNKDKTLAVFEKKNGNYPLSQRTGIMVARRKLWEEANEKSKTVFEREHQFPIIFSKEKILSTLNKVQLKEEEIFYKVNHKFSIDTFDDLTFFRVIYDILNLEDKEFNLKNAVELILRKPYLKQINDKNYKEDV